MKTSFYQTDRKEILSTGYGQLSFLDGLRLRGIAILMIVLHNFFHLLSPMPRENEFQFVKANSVAFLKIIWDSPQETIRCIFSFLGYFGVQIFIFLSAYGLTRKFLLTQTAYKTFIKSRYLKIYPVFLLAIGLWLSKITFFSGPARSLDFLLNKDLLFSVLAISNLIPEQQFKPVGPWWFMSFIFQFYFLFPLLFYYSQKTKEWGLVILGAAGILFMALFNHKIVETLGVNLFFTPLGHLPEIALGILLARQPKPIRHPVLICLAAIPIFALGLFYKPWWYLNHLSALIILLGIYYLFRPVYLKQTLINNFLLFYGIISLPLFLTNGYLRQPWLDIGRNQSYWLMDVLLALLFLLITTIASAGLCLCNIPIQQFISNLTSDSKKPS